MPSDGSCSGWPGVLLPSWRKFLMSSMRERIAGQVQQRVQQHRAVAVREHEAVAVRPQRIAGVVLQEVAPQHLRRCRPCPSACPGGRSWRAARRPWRARGWHWRVRGVWSCGGASRGSGEPRRVHDATSGRAFSTTGARCSIAALEACARAPRAGARADARKRVRTRRARHDLSSRTAAAWACFTLSATPKCALRQGPRGTWFTAPPPGRSVRLIRS